MENTQNPTPLTSERKYVRGWLSFFLFTVGFGSLVSLVMIFTDSSPDNNDVFISYLIFGVDLLFSLALVALACYTIYSFWYIQPNAVFLGKLYIGVVFASHILTLLSGAMEDVGWSSFLQVLKGLLWAGVWFSYLCLSDQVAELFPKENRKIFKRDKYFAFSLLTIPALLFLIYLFSYLGSGNGATALSSF